MTGKEQENPARAFREEDVIADIFKRMDAIQEDLAHERRQRKRLAGKIEER